MTSKANKAKLKPHEIVLKSLVIDERITRFILTVLGIKESNDEQLGGVIRTNEKLKKSYFNLFTAEALLSLPKLNLNIHSQRAQGEWIKSDNLLKISNDENYEKLLEEAINTIYPPKNVRADGLIPLTFFLPDSVEMDGDNLIGKKSCWNFITIKSESTSQATGSLELINNPDSLFGLRFFSIFQSLGLVDPLQSPKKNTLFSNVIQSTGLGNHFNLVNSRYIKLWKMLNNILKISLEKLEKIDIKINNKIDKRDSIANDYDCDKGAKLQLEIETLDSDKTTILEEITNSENELEKLNNKVITNNITQSFYYCTKKHTPSDEELEDGIANFTLPAFKFTDSPIFQTNIIELDGNIPAKRFMERMQFMLSYLLSMTSGTAITFLLKPEKTELKGKKVQGLETPTIILPKIWNELALGIKQHNPKESVENYFESTDKKSVDKTTYQQALYYDFWHKRQELLRCIPTGKGISLMNSTITAPTPKKKSPKKTT